MPIISVKRSTLPLDCEPLVPAPEDILCPGSEDETSQAHRRKRRRIEQNAQQYLRGQPLFILSAGLRGPFDDKWINPWARKRRQESVNQLDRQNGGFSRFSLPENGPEAASRVSNNFPAVNYKRDLNRTAKTHQPTTKWLKSENTFFQSPREDRPRSPTPTPVTKSRDRGGLSSTTPDVPLLKKSPPPQVSLTESHQSPKTIHNISFTPINKRNSPNLETLDRIIPPAPADSPKSKDDHETAQVIQHDHYKVKQLFQGEDNKDALNNGHLGASRPSLKATAAVPKNPIKADENRLRPLGSGAGLEDNHLGKAASTKVTGVFEGSLQALPPSTNLPEFEYRYAIHYKDRPSFAETLEKEKAKAKAEAQEQMIRRLSFTASGGVKKSKTRTRRRLQKGSGSPPDQPRTSSLKQATSSESTKDPSETLSTSHDVNNQPEAQVADSIVAGLVPSGLSLETDKSKFPSIDEGDSYTHLSTQAAVFRAEQSFQNSVVPFSKFSPQHRRRLASSELSPTAIKKIQSTSMPIPTFQDPSNNAKSPTPENEEEMEGAMSTQAMVDAMSPFALTTVKKKKLTSFAITPNSPIPAPFAPHKLSMSTTPTHNSPPVPISRTHSKPSSSGLMSFSLVPSGSLSERYQHDGQQQPRQNYVDSSCDLDNAIEEAGHFLGDWDVEIEARKEGKRGALDARNRTHGSKRDEGLRGGLVEGVGGSG